MTNEQEQNTEYIALLAEEMSQEELHVLLQRLGEREFGDPKPTIGAVVEATGTDAMTVSKMLIALRNDTVRERIGGVIDLHEVRISSLEQKVERLRQMQQFSPVSMQEEYARHHYRIDLNDYVNPEIHEIEAKQRSLALQKIIFWAAVCVLLIMFFMFIFRFGSPTLPQGTTWSSSVPGGRILVGREGGCVFVSTSGEVRWPSGSVEEDACSRIQLIRDVH